MTRLANHMATDRDETRDEDETLWRNARAGDVAAREALFYSQYDWARRVAFRHLGNLQDAEDAVQDAFVKAHRGLAEFDGRSAFQTWLRRIVINAAMDLGRRRGRRHATSLDALEAAGQPQPLAVHHDPSLSLRRDDLQQALDEALAKLSDILRMTFILFAEGDYSYREIAEALDIPIGTVMSRIHSAREKLQEHLQHVDGI